MPLRDGAPEEARLVVVGLGNPGARYEETRHNTGAVVVALLARRAGETLRRHRSGCLAADTTVGGRRAVLARPLTYMNDSGRPVRELVRWYRSSPADLLVVHDELDIPFGQVRVKLGGGIAGHNGLASVVAHLGTRDFGRVRVGISRPAGRRDPVDWVLERFTGSERKQLPEIVERAADAVERVAAAGYEAAMNEFNARPADRA
ncbi:MAG TPA: aminoacyl-tRNA hydrolase [Actinomycetota bacterium]|nr:aminoacyl-tRNA hydrolase [Actinomycetota bacterium]